MEKIKFHSITDLITNSSTTIYTFSDNSLKAFEEMVDEFFKAFGLNYKCSDVFTSFLSFDDGEDTYVDYLLSCFGCDKNEPVEDEPSLYDEEDDDVNKDSLNKLDIPKKYRHPKTCSSSVKALIKDIISGRANMPDWFVKLEKKVLSNSREYGPGTTLHIAAKDPKYEKLAKLVFKFLYSTESVECCS